MRVNGILKFLVKCAKPLLVRCLLLGCRRFVWYGRRNLLPVAGRGLVHRYTRRWRRNWCKPAWWRKIIINVNNLE